jgi:hypothetical protein
MGRGRISGEDECGRIPADGRAPSSRGDCSRIRRGLIEVRTRRRRSVAASAGRERVGSQHSARSLRGRRLPGRVGRRRGPNDTAGSLGRRSRSTTSTNAM